MGCSFFEVANYLKTDLETDDRVFLFFQIGEGGIIEPPFPGGDQRLNLQTLRTQMIQPCEKTIACIRPPCPINHAAALRILSTLSCPVFSGCSCTSS